LKISIIVTFSQDILKKIRKSGPNIPHARTDLEGPASVDETVGTLEVSVREESGRVQVVDALGQVGHKAELERVVQLETLVFQHVLTTQQKSNCSQR